MVFTKHLTDIQVTVASILLTKQQDELNEIVDLAWLKKVNDLLWQYMTYMFPSQSLTHTHTHTHTHIKYKYQRTNSELPRVMK